MYHLTSFYWVPNHVYSMVFFLLFFFQFSRSQSLSVALSLHQNTTTMPGPSILIGISLPRFADATFGYIVESSFSSGILIASVEARFLVHLRNMRSDVCFFCVCVCVCFFFTNNDCLHVWIFIVDWNRYTIFVSYIYTFFSSFV